MALPVCALCGENEAAQMITNLETGESLAICADDFPTFVLGLAEKMMESGQIELPEPEQPAPAESHDTRVVNDDGSEIGSETSQNAPGAIEDEGGTEVAPKPQRNAAGKTRRSGPSSAESTAAPTDTVDMTTADVAEMPAGVVSN